MRWLWCCILALVLWSGPASAQYMWCINEDVVYAEVEGTTVTFFHDAALYNCCSNPFEYSTFWENGHQVVLEDEILVNGCWCQCCYNLSVTIVDVPPGEQVIVFRWYDEESNNWIDVELTVTVPNEDTPQEDSTADKIAVGSYFQTPCLDSAAPVPDDPADRAVSWDALKAHYK